MHSTYKIYKKRLKSVSSENKNRNFLHLILKIVIIVLLNLRFQLLNMIKIASGKKVIQQGQT